MKMVHRGGKNRKGNDSQCAKGDRGVLKKVVNENEETKDLEEEKEGNQGKRPALTLPRPVEFLLCTVIKTGGGKHGGTMRYDDTVRTTPTVVRYSLTPSLQDKMIDEDHLQ